MTYVLIIKINHFIGSSFYFKIVLIVTAICTVCKIQIKKKKLIYIILCYAKNCEYAINGRVFKIVLNFKQIH